MKSKSLFTLLSLATVVFMSSMMIMHTGTLQNVSNEGAEFSEKGIIQHHPTKFHKGVITIKLREGVGNYEQQSGKVATGIHSLDEKFSHFEVSLLEKRFTFNPEKWESGMPDLSRIYKIHFPEKYSVGTVVRAFQGDPNIEYAEPIPVNYKCEVPNDEMYDDMYHLPRIMAEEAWDIHKGENGPEIVIGIVDDAVDWRHNDLVDNVWENLGEDFDGDGHVIEFNGSEWIFDPDDENGIDDDGNGKIDDFVGWDYINEFEEQDNDPTPNMPSIDHGTHCIGIANSRTNNILMVASIAWNVKFVTAKVCNDGDQYFDYDPYEALVYIAELGVDIITNSWTSGYSQANHEAIAYAQGLGCIIVAAAGNYSDEILMYPASYPGVVSVAATSQWDYIASFSSYGIGIDVCAPGVNILSLKPNNLTQLMSGTSMATPLTAGFLALVKSYYPAWPNEMIINQALGTADDIDSINPSMANKLGYGRINAYRALTETNVSTQQELRLTINNTAATDENGNGIFEPGELMYMGFEIRNFSVGLDTTPVTYTLSSSSPYVTIVSDEITVNVPSDDYLWADSAFQFQISPTIDSVRLITFEIHAESSLPIPLENDWPVEILVNQNGLLVFNGIGTGNSYSGEYIRDFLLDEGLQVYYTEQFPPTLNGFDAVFLSFGNYGITLSNGTYISLEMTETIIDYLYSGGFLYEDCGSFFGSMAYFEYANLEEIQDLCSVDTVVTPMEENSINLLTGLDGSLGLGMVFNGSSQSPNYYIDIMTPDSNGTAMFEEDGYGIVAVQGEGTFGQKTVCMSYSIEHLDDDTLGTSDQLLARIAEFFELLTVDLDEPAEKDAELSMNVYPNPVYDITNIDYTLPDFGHVVISIYNIQGKEVLQVTDDQVLPGKNSVQVNVSTLSAGIYILRLISGNDAVIQKIVKY